MTDNWAVGTVCTADEKQIQLIWMAAKGQQNTFFTFCLRLYTQRAAVPLYTSKVAQYLASFFLREILCNQVCSGFPSDTDHIPLHLFRFCRSKYPNLNTSVSLIPADMKKKKKKYLSEEQITKRAIERRVRCVRSLIQNWITKNKVNYTFKFFPNETCHIAHLL